MAKRARPRMIQFTNKDGQRKTIGLGRMGFTQRQFEDVEMRVRRLVSAQLSAQVPDPETAKWLSEIGAPLAKKLAEASLIDRPVAASQATLGAFLDEYIGARNDVKGSTRLVYDQARGYLVEFFGKDKPLRDITPGDADDWRRWLVNREGTTPTMIRRREKLSDNTIRRRTGLARQFFRAAARKGLIPSNPFDGLPGSVRPNPKRFHFVSQDDAARILRACPDSEWRLIFALARYGGLRTPSETLALRWSDIDWERNRITVHSPKTEHHVGGDSRQIPIFPELRPYLEAASARMQDGAEFVIAKHRIQGMNLRSNMTRIIQKTGVKPWPKLFQNLRSTRETELTEHWPLHVVCAWIGNTQAVAAKHYLQVTDEHFEQATQQAGYCESAARALQQPSADECTEAQTPTDQPAETPLGSPLQTSAAPCGADSYGEWAIQDLNL